jgi:hypothetical protein
MKSHPFGYFSPREEKVIEKDRSDKINAHTDDILGTLKLGSQFNSTISAKDLL